MSDAPHTTYIVIMQDDDGLYMQATRRVFPTREMAEHYASVIARSRFPMVIEIEHKEP